MKRIGVVIFALAASALTLQAEKVEAGPKGGRLLATEPQKAEFFVNKERKVEIAFYDPAGKPVAPGGQVVAVTAEPKSGKVAVPLEKTPAGFVSSAALPDAAEPYRVVVQVRATPDAKPKNFRIDLNLEHCGGCDKAEYACTCGH